MINEKLQTIIEQVVDLLMPELTPYETNLYVLFLKNSYLQNGTSKLRVGKRTLAGKIGRGSRTDENISYKQISKTLKGLEQKGVIRVGDTNRDGTQYTVLLPEEIPLVIEKLSIATKQEVEDYFTEPQKRTKLFERDKWTCCYCGDKVTKENVTLDHLIPQHKGGMNTKDNLKTCCLICNSIKSGKTYKEAAPFLLKSIQEKRAKNG